MIELELGVYIGTAYDLPRLGMRRELQLRSICVADVPSVVAGNHAGKKRSN